MKTNLKIILLCAVFLVIILILWLTRGENELKPSSLSQFPATNIPSAHLPAISQTNGQQTNKGTTAIPSITNSSQLNPPAPERTLQTLVEGKNKSIDFWGMVMDQDGNPLPGVKVIGNTRTWYVTATMNFDSRFPEFSAVSDSGGKFEIHNVSGDVLTIKSLQDEGYEPEPGALRGFGYNTSERFSSDPNNPIILKMWKTNIHAQLIVGKKRFHIVPDGRMYVINLAKGMINESGEGDLKVWIRYQASSASEHLYDWSSEIDVINGGLLQETDDYSSMYLAPIDGYTPIFHYPQHPQQIRSGQRGSTGTKRFYVMLNHGQEYGRITVELVAPYNDQIPGMIDIQYVVNPSGSRFLKP